MGEQTEPRPLPHPILHEHEYLYVIATELRGIRASIDALAASMAAAPATPGEVTLREPEAKPKPKRG